MKATTENPNIRISAQSKAILRLLAKKEGKPMQAVLGEAVERYQQEKFLDEVNAAYAALRKNPRAWKEEESERDLWDKTLADGIEGE